MKPGIKRSIGQGFRAANASWPGIGVFAGSLLGLMLIGVLAIALTRPPAAALQGRAELGAIPVERPASPAAPTEATDLFNQMGDTEVPTPAGESPPAATEQAAAPADEPEPAAAGDLEAERDRAVNAWLGRSWPVLLVTFLVLMLANLWLNGGQIGYLAKRIRTGQSSLAELWASGIRAFTPLLLSSLLSLAAVVVVVLAVAALAALLGLLPGIAGRILGVLLGIAFVIAFVWLIVRVSFWFIAVAADRVGPIAGLRASFRATRRRWWRVAGLGLLLALISYAVWLPFGLIEWAGGLAGGAAEVVFGLIGNLAGLVAGLYVGFAALSAYIRFYEDAKTDSPA